MNEEPKTFEEVVKPAMEWLAKNKHPHTSIVIEANRAEMLEGVECFTTNEFIAKQMSFDDVTKDEKPDEYVDPFDSDIYWQE